MHDSALIARICNALAHRHALNNRDVDDLEAAFARSSVPRFDAFLLEENVVEYPVLLQALSDVYQIPSCDVRGMFFERSMLQEFPKDFLLRNEIIPRERIDDNMMIMVAADPENSELRERIAQFVSYAIEFEVGIARDIEDAIKEYYDKAPTEVDPDGDDDESDYFFDVVDRESL